MVKRSSAGKTVEPLPEVTGRKYDFAFCLGRALEGKALIELRQLPQIVGGMTRTAADRVSQLFRSLAPTLVRASDVEIAEMIKLIGNGHRDAVLVCSNGMALASNAVRVIAPEVIQEENLSHARRPPLMPGPAGGPYL